MNYSLEMADRRLATAEAIAAHELETFMRRVAQGWVERFPKRSLEWIDAMGIFGWKVDGERLGDLACGFSDARLDYVFSSLASAQDEYCDFMQNRKLPGCCFVVHGKIQAELRGMN